MFLVLDGHREWNVVDLPGPRPHVAGNGLASVPLLLQLLMRSDGAILSLFTHSSIHPFIHSSTTTTITTTIPRQERHDPQSFPIVSPSISGPEYLELFSFSFLNNQTSQPTSTTPSSLERDNRQYGGLQLPKGSRAEEAPLRQISPNHWSQSRPHLTTTRR